MVSLPVILVESGDLHVFGSIEEAESDAEPVDVRNSEYVAHDSEGRLLCLKISRKEKPFLFGLGKIDMECGRIESADDIP